MTNTHCESLLTHLPDVILLVRLICLMGVWIEVLNNYTVP